MTDHYQFWALALTGAEPETTPGTPWAGYYIQRSYVSLPHSIPAKRNSTSIHRPLVEMPVAIWWNEQDGWNALVDDLMKNRHTTGTANVDEIFSRVCRQPITWERYNAMRDKIEEWREGR